MILYLTSTHFCQVIIIILQSVASTFTSGINFWLRSRFALALSAIPRLWFSAATLTGVWMRNVCAPVSSCNSTGLVLLPQAETQGNVDRGQLGISGHNFQHLIDVDVHRLHC